MTTVSLAQSYLIKALLRLKILDLLLAEGAYSDVVREAQEIVELAMKGMLRQVGVEPPKAPLLRLRSGAFRRMYLLPPRMARRWTWYEACCKTLYNRIWSATFLWASFSAVGWIRAPSLP